MQMKREQILRLTVHRTTQHLPHTAATMLPGSVLVPSLDCQATQNCSKLKLTYLFNRHFMCGWQPYLPASTQPILQDYPRSSNLFLGVLPSSLMLLHGLYDWWLWQMALCLLYCLFQGFIFIPRFIVFSKVANLFTPHRYRNLSSHYYGLALIPPVAVK